MTNALRDNEVLPCYSEMIDTPDGKMWVTIVERNGVPVQVIVSIGKTGSYTMAWANAASLLITRLLEFITIHQVIQELSGIATGRLAYLTGGDKCRSGPEGIAIALLRYRKEKYSELGPEEDGRARLDP